MKRAMTAREEFMRLCRMDPHQQTKLAVMLLVATGASVSAIKEVASHLTTACLDEITADAVDCMDEIRRPESLIV